jgi:hypothetical protein
MDTISRRLRHLMPNLFNERGEIIAPFIEALPEEVRTSLPAEVINDPEIASFKDLGEVISAAKASKKPWIESLPEEIRNDPNISKYKTPEEFAKGHLNVVKLVGAKGVIIPKDDAPPEEKEKFYQTLGKPVKAEEYKLSDVALHPNIKAQYNDNTVKVFKDMAHQANLTQAQADFLHRWYFENASKAEVMKAQTTEKAIKDGETALRTEWGADYNKKLSNVQTVVKKFGGQEVIDALGDIGSNPKVVKFIAKLSEHFSEDDITQMGDKGTPTEVNTAKEKIKAILADKTHPYWKGDQAAIKEVTELYKVAYPDGAE